MDALDDLRHLWDGSEPGWRLRRTHYTIYRAIFRFAPSGPSIREIAALRNCLDELRDTPTQAVWNQLRGLSSYELPERLGNLQTQALRNRASKLGLTLDVISEDAGGCLPIGPGNMVVLIEDNALAEQVAAKMIQAGVPVDEVHVD